MGGRRGGGLWPWAVGAALAALLLAVLSRREEAAGEEPEMPVVDLAKLRAGDASARLALLAAAKGQGVARLTGHGVATEEARRAGEAYFALPTELKGCEGCSLRNASVGLQRGYVPFAAESGLADVLEVKEGFCYGLDWPKGRPAEHPHQVANVWPPEAALDQLGPAWRPAMEAHLSEALGVAGSALASLTADLQGGEQLEGLCAGGESISQMRLFHYLPPPASSQKRCLGSSPHTDWHVLTVISRDEASRLQVVGRRTGRWLDVPSRAGELVLLVGDWLSAFSGGSYRSAPHRVLLPEGRSSLSFVFFLNPSPSARLPQGATGAREGGPRPQGEMNSVELSFYDLPWGDYVVQKWAQVMSNR